MMNNPYKRVLAVASGGGHWEQLMLLRPTLEHHDICFATTDVAFARQQGIDDAAILPDCNQHTKLRSLWCAFAALFLVLRLRPEVIISTGAAPGFFCILSGRLLGARTLWIDSIANAEELSMCGKLCQACAHQCLTQWEHLEKGSNPRYFGALL
jgi:UDP-N-acetylglucosamine:LPS N-acetylglucosamine transferase